MRNVVSVQKFIILFSLSEFFRCLHSLFLFLNKHSIVNDILLRKIETFQKRQDPKMRGKQLSWRRRRNWETWSTRSNRMRVKREHFDGAVGPTFFLLSRLSLAIAPFWGSKYVWWGRFIFFKIYHYHTFDTIFLVHIWDLDLTLTLKNYFFFTFSFFRASRWIWPDGGGWGQRRGSCRNPRPDRRRRSLRWSNFLI
jgi:hypothetical protein